MEAISRLRRLHVHFADLLTEMTWCCPVDGDEDLGCKDMGKGNDALLCSVSSTSLASTSSSPPPPPAPDEFQCA